MTWLTFAAAALTAVALLAVVGGVLSWAVGLRGMWAVGAAPAFAMTAIGIAAIVAPWVGLAWSPVPVLLVTAILATALVLVRRRWVAQTSARPIRVDGWLIGALALGILFLAWRAGTVIGEPGNFSQTFDNIFHLNGVRFVLDTGNASSLSLGSMTSPSGTLPFYPAAWHALVALVVGLTGVTIPVGVGAMTVVIASVIWPVGIVLLTRTLFGRARVLVVAAIVGACSLAAFPFLLMDYGVLYPFQLGLALVPAALAAALQSTGLAGERLLPQPWWALILAGTIPGVALAHPGAFVAVLALTLPMVAVFAWRLFRRTRGIARAGVVAGVLTYAVVGVVLLRILRPPADARGWPPALSIPDAILQVLTVSMWYGIPALIVAVAVLAGVAAAVVDRSTPALLALSMYVIAAGLFVVVSALTFQPLRDILTGSWYNNIPRLAAILPITMVPLAAYGVDRAWALVRRLMARAPGRRPAALATAVAAVAATAATAFSVGPVLTVTDAIAAAYRITPDSALVSTDEYTLLQRLDESVPEGVKVAGSAWTGAGLAYALADRPVLMPHTLMENSRDVQAINDGLEDASPGSPVCDALSRQGVGFVLDFGDREIFAGTRPYAGLDDLGDSTAVRLVDSEGTARLYEIVACG